MLEHSQVPTNMAAAPNRVSAARPRGIDFVWTNGAQDS